MKGMITLKQTMKRALVVLALSLAACQGNDTGHAESAGGDAAEGPHHGRLLTDGEIQTEVTIYEAGIPPQFRVYFYENGQPVDPDRVDLTIELHRFAGRTDVIRFESQEDYLLGDQVVEEPHSFDVIVTAEYQGKVYRWEYESHEGRTQMSDEVAQLSGIEIELAGLATIKETIRVFGHIAPNEDRLKKVAPRFRGVVKEVRKKLGESVANNEVMAVVESNKSLLRYKVRSAISGTVIRKDVTAGEFVDEGQTIYTVADLSQVWVDLDIPRKDFGKLRLGQEVVVYNGADSVGTEGKIGYISPFGALDTQTMLARVELPNPDGRWRPGLFVVAEIIVDEATVPLAVRTEGLQVFRDWDVVFARADDVFEIAIVELGRRDAEWAEVVSGLAPGQRYATKNSFIIKADIGKSGATHAH